MPPVHKASLKRNTQLFLWFAIPALKLVSLSLGCGPSDGENGGTCKESFCGRGGVCNEGLSCGQNNKCQPSPPSPPTCSSPFWSAQCAADESAIRCDPNAEIPETCAAHSKPVPGDTLLCCAPCNDAPSFCKGPAVGFACSGAHTPAERDPSLECVGVSFGTFGAAYCCASNACFGIEGPDCEDAGRPYACTGTATPSDPGLACVAVSDAPGHYCCADKDAGTD